MKLQSLDYNSLPGISQRVFSSLSYYDDLLGQKGLEERSHLSSQACRILQRCIGRSDFQTMSIVTGGADAGFIVSRNWSKRCREVFWLVVFQDFKRKGLAKFAMLETTASIKHSFLTVHPKNAPAIRLYQSIGFEPTSKMTKRHVLPRQYFVKST